MTDASGIPRLLVEHRRALAERAAADRRPGETLHSAQRRLAGDRHLAVPQ